MNDGSTSECASNAVTVDGNRISYVSAGDPDDPTVVLLHGGIIDAGPLSWGAVLDPLAAGGYHAVAPDLLGYGDSSVPAGPYSIDRHRAVVEGFVAELGLREPALVGLSMGGGVALAVHLDGDTPIDRLCLVSSFGLGSALPNGRLSYVLAQVQLCNRIAIALFRRSRRFTRASLGGIVYDLDALDPHVVDEVYRYVRKPNAGVAFRRFRAAEVTRDGYRTEFSDRLDAVSVPTLFLHGAHDDVMPVAWAERAAERVPNASLDVFEDCAHWLPREAPDRTADRLIEFLDADV